MSQIETFMSSKVAMVGLAIVAFLVAALLVLVIVRILFGGRLRMPGGRARQARLGIVDAFDLDRQRQLIIVRRDNTEHLIMIGGPNDILIESEIVRIEARDFRDGRRDQGDARIPAPIPAERGDGRMTEAPRPSADEPMLPMPLPETQPTPSVEMPPVVKAPAPIPAPPSAFPGQPLPGPKASDQAVPGPVTTIDGGMDATPPTRVPSFPLPPRRPMPTPERRPPLPPRLPDSVTRSEDPATGIPLPEPVRPAEPTAIPDVKIPDAKIADAKTADPKTVTPSSALAPPVAAPARTAPPFLKPLPPRPPVRPLQRTTPQPPAPPIVDAVPPVADTAPPPASKPAPPKPRPAAPPQPAAKPPESVDALESLEEEMAKLLGRGPG